MIADVDLRPRLQADSTLSCRTLQRTPPTLSWLGGLLSLLVLSGYGAARSFGQSEHTADWAAFLIVGGLLPVCALVVDRWRACDRLRYGLAAIGVGTSLVL